METCDTCVWVLPDHPVNRAYYGDDTEWPICGRVGSPKTGEHVEPTFGCEKYAKGGGKPSDSTIE